LTNEQDATRWTEEEMFHVNEVLNGRKVDYDGNPHVFAEQGFQGNDPHAFRVVGGSFMNTPGGTSEVTPTTTNPQARYQPLVNTAKDNDDIDILQPFFTTTGATPWGEVIEAAKTSSDLPVIVEPDVDGLAAVTTKTRASQDFLMTTLKVPSSSSSSKSKKGASASTKPQIHVTDGMDYDDNDDDWYLDGVVLTDKEITARRQAEHEKEKRMLEQYEIDTKFVKDWVLKLPNPTGFKIQNVDDIIAKHFGPGY
jgi:mRNA-decapping enzyme subunit 2